MKYNSLVSVIMSAYNENEEWVKKAIESILNQSYSNLEFFIILDNPDNISLDKLILKYVKRDERIIYIKNHKNEGLVNSLNKGIIQAKGDFIVRMDADDISFKDRVEKQVRFMHEHQEIALLCTKAIFINEAGVEIGESREYKDVDVLKNCLKYKNDVVHPTWIMRAKTLKSKEINGYRNIPYAEDYDLLCRLLLNDFRVYQLRESTLHYRIRSNGITQSKIYDQIKVASYISKMYKDKKENVKAVEEIQSILNEKESFIVRRLRRKKVSKLRIYIFKIFNKYGRKILLNTFVCRFKYNI
ncbi:glycosyltransferase [Clostridium fungisolvens]|uniref:Glycosyltransferase 2-like domain-containing protein n=1 Tax=Clostridium fungisolvens TaxID=1604897 RepID=A0A6V8SAC9_9CLOT|nr:glycosyltransferase [Clostridium fungisolvens]GFP74199.1 hypothetical protein bsdtw1_00244 [Clostridium fungisolvens]